MHAKHPRELLHVLPGKCPANEFAVVVVVVVVVGKTGFPMREMGIV
jgi:hypothetical protein